MRPDVILCANYSPWSSYSGGVQKSVDHLATALCELGQRVDVLYSRSPFERFDIPRRHYGINWVPFLGFRPDMSSPLRWLNAVGFAHRAGQLAGPGTVLHGNGDEAWLLHRVGCGGVLYQHRQPHYPKSLHGDWGRGHRLRLLLNEPRHYSYVAAWEHATLRCAVSEHARQKLELSYPRVPGEAALLPNGIDPAFLRVRIPENRSGILYFGRLAEDKGVLELASAYCKLPRAIRERHALHLVGAGECHQRLESQLGARIPDTQFVFHGRMLDEALAAQVAAAALVVLPSRDESFGNSMLEATAAGHRILTTACGPVRQNLNRFAEYVSLEQQGDLLQAMLARFSSDGHALLVASPEEQRLFVQQNFSWQSTAKQAIELYEEVRALARSANNSANSWVRRV